MFDDTNLSASVEQRNAVIRAKIDQLRNDNAEISYDMLDELSNILLSHSNHCVAFQQYGKMRKRVVAPSVTINELNDELSRYEDINVWLMNQAFRSNRVRKRYVGLGCDMEIV